MKGDDMETWPEELRRQEKPEIGKAA